MKIILIKFVIFTSNLVFVSNLIENFFLINLNLKGNK